MSTGSESTNEEFLGEVGEYAGEYLEEQPPPLEQMKKFISDESSDESQSHEEEQAKPEPEVEEEEEEEEVYYDTQEYISKPYLSQKCTLPENILNFNFSYGYDCQRLYNLCVIDKVVLIFASGNLIHFFDTSNNKKWYRRCHSGRGIGHITTNPSKSHVAVGEKGDNPLIIIYDWPSFEIVTILRYGTKTNYTFLNYSPDGELLASQGGHPDYMLTIWNWRKHKIMLRSKAFGQTVFNSRFSLYVPGHLTSSGISHIKFWKINRTFTGLKLLGELGRFGKSEICNVIGFLALPDEKVVSGCEWGNILVWDGGLIKLEVFKRGKNFCHDAPITQFIYNNGELTTIAMDGTIKMWYYETIELADPPEDEKFIEVDPIFEYEIGDYYHKAKLLKIVKSDPEDPEDHTWFGQDGNGGIWSLDLTTSGNANPPSLIYSCHAGRVVAIQCSPFSPHLASLGEDGKIFIYDYVQQSVIMKKEFLAGGCSLLWLPLTVEDSGCVLVGGFTDGIIRVLCVSIHEYNRTTTPPQDDYISLIQVSKPHTKPVTVVSLNPKQTILVTGSEDCTLFVYQIQEGSQFVNLVPIGFIHVPGEVTHCTWKPKREATVLISCKNGAFCEVDLPQEPPSEDPVSYLLENVIILRNDFVSIKSEIQRKLKMNEIRQERLRFLEEKRIELQKKNEEPGVQLDIEAILEALKQEMEAEEPDLPEPYIPNPPNPILFANYLGKMIWLSMGGFDAGYMYLYSFQQEGPVKYNMVADADGIEIRCYYYYHNHRYLILGMRDGTIRVVRVNDFDITDLSDYWSISMHDNDNGAINQICFNYNYSYMFSCGDDGNVFSYKFNPEGHDFKPVHLDNVSQKDFPNVVAADIDDISALSLEQMKNRLEHEENLKEANIYKRQLTERLKIMEKQFEGILRKNAKLPKSQQIPPSELALNEKITKDLNNSLAEEMDLVIFKLAWQLEKSTLQYQKVLNYFLAPVEIHSVKVFGINNKNIFAKAFRQKQLGPNFGRMKELAQMKLEEQEAKGRTQAKTFSEAEIVDTIKRRPNPAEALLKQIMALCGDYKKNIKLRRLLRKYRDRKDRLEMRRIEWYEMMKKKPNPDKPDAEDVVMIQQAKDTIGNYQLKTAPDYKVPKRERITTVKVYDQLLKTREKIFQIKKEYNRKVLALRQKKLDMIERHQMLREMLLEIAKEIPKEKVRNPPNLPTIVEEAEFPEKKFEFTMQGVYDELPKRYRNIYKEENAKKKEMKPLDREYEMLVADKKVQKPVKVPSRLTLMKFSGITGSEDIRDLQEFGKDDQIATPWEKECKKLRVIRRLYEQDMIIEEMETSIQAFDEEVTELVKSRYQTDVDVKFLELFLLTLHQEVLILKRFEVTEEEKEGKLFEKLREKHHIQKIINEINNKVEIRNRDIRRYEEEIKTLITTFHAEISDNKFYDFLKRIFKKKYRPPKVKSDDSISESSDESSSSSEEEDAKSLDSKDFGTMRLDENICPPGCDPKLYEWTFTQRTARHNLELKIQDEKKFIELHKKEYDRYMKEIKLVESQYQVCKEDLEEYIREKQRNLNEVETVVILNLNQIQNFKSESDMEKLSQSIIFSSSKLTNLYNRVGELEKEIQKEKTRHEKNRHHLMRMKIDVNHMKELSSKLTEDIDEAMIRKCGKKVDMDDIEESILKRLVAEMSSIVMDLERSFQRKLGELKQARRQKEDEYQRKKVENTERYNLLAVLQEEKLRIQDTINRQDKLMCQEREEDVSKDIIKLKEVMESQEKKIAYLKNEIGMLKLKVKPKPNLEGSSAVFQRMPFKTCDGNLEEMNLSVHEELKDMCEEALEIIKDAKQYASCEEDYRRMRTLLLEMFKKLPPKCREDVIKRLSSEMSLNVASEKNTESTLELIREKLNADSFLKVIETIKEFIDTFVVDLDDFLK